MEHPEDRQAGQEAPVTPPRRYGLFGVSAYPQKDAFEEQQRRSMARWISVVIVLMAVAVVAMLLFSATSPGLTVTFEPMGGSALPTQSVQYGQRAVPPGETVRPGYLLVGWSTAPDGAPLWDFASDPVTDTLVLYAIWMPEPAE